MSTIDASQSFADSSNTPAAGIKIGTALLHAPEAKPSRSAGTIDSVQLEIVRGAFKPPVDGAKGWKATALDKDGNYSDDAIAGGWCYVPVDSPDERVVLLNARGHALVYVNGEPRAGDVYATGYVTLPVLLHKGVNDFLFAGGRGELTVKFEPVRHPVMFDNRDITSGDFIDGIDRTQLGVVVINATTQPVTPIIGGDGRVTRPQTILPMSVRKIAVDVTRPQRAMDKPMLDLTVGDDTTQISFTSKKSTDTHRVSFISKIDDSVQYLSVVPATNPTEEKLATVLSLHGASVEATSQANAYSPKSWCNIICPTNRRPYGFDWEDWGRLDALEVLDNWTTSHPSDPSRVYLTGHSMGGHGTWQVGSLFPDKFAAIGPSAGWLSFELYTSSSMQTRESPASAPSTRPTSRSTTTRSAMTEISKPTVLDLFKRTALGSNTPEIMPNLIDTGVYALHGTDDDNVPIAQARMGMKILDGFNHDHQLFEKPGVGHWWDDSDEPGAACVDWPQMFDFFARHRLPANEEVRDIDFRTPNPGVSGKCFWATIEQQIEPGKMSSIKLHADPLQHRLTGSTENVARLTLVTRSLVSDRSTTLHAKLDGQEFGVNVSNSTSLTRGPAGWGTSGENEGTSKNVNRTGPFKQAFANNMLWVYGTSGTPEENKATFEKVRYDSETWYVRANGSVDIMTDRQFVESGNNVWKTGRNVILFGNADNNSAWSLLIGEDSPIGVKRGSIIVNGHSFEGDDLAALFLRPRKNSTTDLVGVVASTGVAGTRLTHRLGYFSSGVQFPDWCVIDPTILSKGLRAAKAAGYFDNDWNFSEANSAFSE